MDAQSSAMIRIIFAIFILPYSVFGEPRLIDSYQKSGSVRYEPNWDSIDSRPLPDWYDDVKFGIFLHWGVYSVPSFGSEWFWSNWNESSEKYVEFMKDNYPPGFTYQQFAPEFKAEFFDPDEWADVFHKSGAKYIVLTSKHHEGFTLWPSSRAFSWNAKDVGPHKDLVDLLSRAVRSKGGMRFGVYYSLYEWFNPMYLKDKSVGFKNQTFVNEKMLPELHELVNSYRPEILWTDGDWEADYEYWKSTEFLAWLYNESPVKDTVVVNDRWGSNIPCNHGGYYTCTDRYNPGVLQSHKWENCMTIDKKSWGYRRNAPLSEFMNLHELITELVTTVSCGGNLLMNVGPTKDGMLAPIFQDRLHGIGNWLEVNGEAIYKTKPWIYQNDTVNSEVWYTAAKESELTNQIYKASDGSTVYAIVLKWPDGNKLTIEALKKLLDKNSDVYMLNKQDIKLTWEEDENGVHVHFPDKAIVVSTDAWALRITGVSKKQS